MSLLKRLMIVVAVCFGMSGCVIEDADAQVPVYQGCVVMVDPVQGEYETCNTNFIIQESGAVILYEPAWNVWVGPGYWWGVGGWHTGWHAGWWNRYHTGFRPHGWYGARGYSRGYYRSYNGAYRSYGGYRAYGGHYGGGVRGGGFHGGRR